MPEEKKARPPPVMAERHDGGIVVLTLTSEPVNIMGLAFWKQLLAAFEAAEQDSGVRAVVFQSGLKRPVFTAGLDVTEFFAPKTSRAQLHNYWGTLTKALTKIYASRLFTVAAVKGGCPAGGCCLALCCDYRVISADGAMGFNEVALGMGGVPPYWAELMASVAGRRATERLVETGSMAPSAELLRLSMVDTVVDAADEVLPEALAEARRWLKNPNDLGRATSKRIMRGAFAKRWAEGVDEEVDFLWGSINEPQVVKGVEAVIAQLSGGGKKAAAPKAKL